MNDLNMNRLPVPTWNQCGVNSAPKAAALPEIPGDDWGEANIAFTLPAGVGEAENDFTAFSESGMGEAVDTYLLENATVRHALTVAEDTKVEAPALFEVTLDAAHPNALSVLSVDAKAGSSLTVVQVVRGDAEGGVSANLKTVPPLPSPASARARTPTSSWCRCSCWVPTPAAGTPSPSRKPRAPRWSRCASSWAAVSSPAVPARC